MPRALSHALALALAAFALALALAAPAAAAPIEYRMVFSLEGITGIDGQPRSIGGTIGDTPFVTRKITFIGIAETGNISRFPDFIDPDTRTVTLDSAAVEIDGAGRFDILQEVEATYYSSNSFAFRIRGLSWLAYVCGSCALLPAAPDWNMASSESHFGVTALFDWTDSPTTALITSGGVLTPDYGPGAGSASSGFGGWSAVLAAPAPAAGGLLAAALGALALRRRRG